MFVRTKAHPQGRRLSARAARWLSIAVYALYGGGCVLQVLPLSPSIEPAVDVLGLVLIAGALVAFAILAGSSLQRQTQEPEAELDERERAERNRAAFTAHSVFAGIVLLGVIYLMLALDLAENGKLALWTPTTGAHWNAVFWGLALLALTLPACALAFASRDDADRDDL